jgi:hypothetical protein
VVDARFTPANGGKIVASRQDSGILFIEAALRPRAANPKYCRARQTA